MSATETDPVVWLRHSPHFIAAVVLAALWTMESLTPMFAGRQRRFSHNATNLALAAINALIASGFAFAILGVTEWANSRPFGLLNLTSLPVWLHWLGAIVLFDCWQYWWHRCNHRVPLLWRFHAVHHSAQSLDWIAGARMHVVEIIILRAATATPAFVLGFSPRS